MNPKRVRCPQCGSSLGQIAAGQKPERVRCGVCDAMVEVSG